MRSRREVLSDGITQAVLLLACAAAFVQLWSVGHGAYLFVGFGAYAYFVIFRVEAVHRDRDLLKEEDMPCNNSYRGHR